MGWGPAVLACLGLAIALATGIAASSARSTPGDVPARPTALLILHGGGFIFEDVRRMRVARELATDAGFDPVYVDYPLFDMGGAIGAAQDAARELDAQGRTVLAYGESVGGTMSALLAQEGLVDAAAAYSPVADMRSFAAHNADPPYYRALIRAHPADLREASPALHDSRRPILALLATGELPYMARDMRRWAHSDKSVAVDPVPGVHIGAGEPAIYRRNVRKALAWLQG